MRLLGCGSETQQKIEALKLRFSVCLWLAGTGSTTEHGIRKLLPWHLDKHDNHSSSVFIHKVGEHYLERCGENVKYSNSNDEGQSLTINAAICNALIIRESVTTNL